MDTPSGRNNIISIQLEKAAVYRTITEYKMLMKVYPKYLLVIISLNGAFVIERHKSPFVYISNESSDPE